MPVDNDYLESLYKGLYQEELSRSDRLDGQINVPTVIAAALFGAAVTYLERPPKFGGSTAHAVLFLVPVAGYAIALLSAVYCLLRSYLGPRQKLIPSPSRIADRVIELVDYYRGNYSEADHDISAGVKAAIQGEMIDLYERAAEANRTINLSRMNWLSRSTVSLVCAMVFLVVSRIVYYSLGI